MKVAALGQCSLDYLTLVETFPKEDTKKEVLDFSVQGGGPAATALAALSRLGARTFFQGVVSDDEAGIEILKGLRADGVDVKNVVVRKGGASQTAFILVSRKTGSRTICWKRPTVEPLKAKEVKASVIRSSDMLLIDGLMVDASFKAVDIARKAGVPVMLDAGRVRAGMMELAAFSDYIVASKELADGLGLSPVKTVRMLSEFNPKAATVTLGARGSVTWHKGTVFSMPAFKVKAIDTTGAGDVFHAGCIYGILKGRDIRKTIEFASAFAALKCLKLGGRAGIPSLEETLRFIKSKQIRCKK